MPEYLTVSEVAASLRVSDQTVWDRIKQGEIKAIKEGRRYLIARSDLQQYLSKREAGNEA